MTTKLAGALTAGALAVGILVGAAGTVLVHDVTGPAMGMGDMNQMMEMMGGGMMDNGMMDNGMMDGTSVGRGAHASHHDGGDR